MEHGVIFDLKEFAVYDGPGMRQTVFLKGCPLRCNWCHNPEGLSCKPQLMVSTASCIHCGHCKQVCTHETCVACGRCVMECPLHLRRIAGTIMTSEQLIGVIRKNSGYYGQYGGGVTFSGGEPLMQSAFLLEVLRGLSDLNRAIETSGYAKPEVFEEVLGQLDFVMMDIKMFDRELHKKFTGVDNQIILQNAKRLCRGNVPFVIRIPMIPGVNDNEENFRATAEWIAGAPMLQRVELLPYHATAGAKYAMLGQEYRPMFDQSRKLQVPQRVFQEYGIRSEVL